MKLICLMKKKFKERAILKLKVLSFIVQNLRNLEEKTHIEILVKNY